MSPYRWVAIHSARSNTRDQEIPCKGPVSGSDNPAGIVFLMVLCVVGRIGSCERLGRQEDPGQRQRLGPRDSNPLF
jgi:hypothetical protein